jgi:naphthalene 1,2-dioxygenase system ferredoxin subunit
MTLFGDWVPTVALDVIDPDYPTMVAIGESEIALCRVGDEAFAVGNICSHAYARLSDGFVEGGEVFCPLHQGSFDVRTGAAVAAPCFEPIASYATRIVDGIVHVAATRRG